MAEKRKGVAGFIDRVKDVFVRPSDTFFQSLDYIAPDFETGRRAIMPEWYYNAYYGQVRGVDINTLRELASTSFIELCVSTIVDDFATSDFKIIPKEGEDEKSSNIQSQIELAKEFYKRPNINGETEQNIRRRWARDVLTIDAGVIVKVFDKQSYKGQYNPQTKQYEKAVETFKTKENKYYKEGLKTGELKNTAEVDKAFHPIKPLGARKLVEIYARDGSTFLPDADPTGFIRFWYQYSWRIPKRIPLVFNKDEVCYSMKNPRSYSFFGWSPVQSIESIVQTLKMQVQYFEGFSKEKGVPDGVIWFEDISQVELDRLKEYWKKEIKGKAHKLAVIGRKTGFTPFMVTSRDMEMLATMQWFQKLVMAQFNINIPILSLSGEAPKAGVEALVKREKMKAVIPLYQMYEEVQNTQILPELGCDKIEYKFYTYDPNEEALEVDIQTKQLASATRTVNEVRTEEGLDPVPWGDAPIQMQFQQMFQQAQETSGRKPFGGEEKIVPTFSEFRSKLKKNLTGDK